VSICDIELIITASKAAARDKHINRRTGQVELYSDAEMFGEVGSVKRRRFIPVEANLERKGYVLHDAVIQGAGQDESDITAVCFKPTDKKSPVVIAFKGTSTVDDVWQDAHIARTGLAKDKAREEAWQLYLKMRATLAPGQEIVLSGHSLGGHFAQYVGARAYAEGHTGVLVRTFNSAPISKQHGSGLSEDKLHKMNNFVNYRTQSDPVSGALTNASRTKELYGDVYSFKTSKDVRWTHPGVDAHKTDIMHLSLSNDVKALQVGSREGVSRTHAYILEKMHIMTEAYEFRVAGEWFANYRTGEKDVASFMLKLPDIKRAIQASDYQGAIEKLCALQKEVRGKSPYLIVASLIDEVVLLAPELKPDPKDVPPEPHYSDYYKAIIVDVFSSDKDHEDDEELTP
jgi:hypothetical protein